MKSDLFTKKSFFYLEVPPKLYLCVTNVDNIHGDLYFYAATLCVLFALIYGEVRSFFPTNLVIYKEDVADVLVMNSPFAMPHDAMKEVEASILFQIVTGSDSYLSKIRVSNESALLLRKGNS